MSEPLIKQLDAIGDCHGKQYVFDEQGLHVYHHQNGFQLVYFPKAVAVQVAQEILRRYDVTAS